MSDSQSVSQYEDVSNAMMLVMSSIRRKECAKEEEGARNELQDLRSRRPAFSVLELRETRAASLAGVAVSQRVQHTQPERQRIHRDQSVDLREEKKE
jgi:hypothetical protein